MPGFFVTFEGVDGAGKTTQLHAVRGRLEGLGATIVTAKEPGDFVNGEYIGSEIGHQIRQMLFHDGKTKTSTGVLDNETVDLLFLADHVQLWKKTIQKALTRGAVVLCDRYADSQFAYGMAKGSTARIQRLYKEFYGPCPNATVLLLGDPELLQSRTKRSGTTEEGKQEGKRWAGVEAQKIVMEAYIRQLVPDPRTITVMITPEKGISQVTDEIWARLEPMYKAIMERDRTVSQAPLFQKA